MTRTTGFAIAPDGLERVVEQRAAVESARELVAPEARRRPAGEHDRRRHSRPAVAAPAGAARSRIRARVVGPRTWPASVRRSSPRRSRSSRITIDVPPAGARRVAERGRCQRRPRRPSRGRVARGRDRSAPPRRGRPRGGRSGRSRSSARTPSGGQPAARAARASDGGAATARAASSRSIASSVWGRQPGGPRGSRSRSPSRAERARRDEPADHDAGATAAAASRRERDEAARGERRRRRAAPAAAGRSSPGRPAWCGGDELERPRAERRLDVRREAPAAGRRAQRPVEVETAARPSRMGAARERRRAVRRQPPARDRRAAGEDRAPTPPPAIDARRGPAEREPVARRGGDRPRRGAGSRATSRPSRSIASRGPRTDERARPAPCRGGGAAARGRPGAAASPAGRAAIATRIRDVATTAAIGRSGPARAAGDRPRSPPSSSAVRPRRDAARPSRRGPGPRGRGRRRRPGTSRRSIPGATGPPRRLPVTTVPRPLTANTRSIARRGRRAPRRRRAPRAPGERRDRRPHAVDPRRRSSRTPRATGDPASVVVASRAADLGHDLARRASSSTRSAFVTTASPSRIPSASRSPRCSSVCALRPVVGRDDQQRGVDLARPDEHVADEPVVPGDVDEVDDRAVRQREVRVADVDRHARAAAPRGAGRRRCRSARGGASSCRGRCARRCR